MVKGRFVSAPIRVPLGPAGLNFERADIECRGVDQSGASFEARVFLNNPTADLNTPLTPEHGYAGAFHVYGYGVWPADVGKDRAARKAASSDSIRAPIDKTIIATEALRAALRHGPDVKVTVVPVLPGNPPRDASDAFKLEDVRIVIH